MSNETEKNTTPKVWVSGAWIHREEMGVKIDQIRQMGYEITHDWTRVEKTPNPTPKEQGSYAKFDIDGVKKSDVAVAVMDDPDYAYRGTCTEIGCALGVGKPLHIVWPYSLNSCEKYVQTNVFFWHPDITHHKSWEDFVRYLSAEYPLE
jgi:nucleoside 2-deoxyribosyltransferase